jgi:energy-converting hydrogenase A subunit R
LKPVFMSDCEGPISKNDNAFEITSHFIPKGDKLFTVISKYDDVLADVLKKQGYSAGSTLKLILPFLKAYGVTDYQIREFSAENLLLIANSKDTLGQVRGMASTFIVSTSYEHYIKALCEALDFPYSNTYCTKLNIDKYSVNSKEKVRLKEIANKIVQMPLICIPAGSKTIGDFSAKDQEIVAQLDKIFWSEILKMNIGRIFSEVKTVGGDQKAEAIEDAVTKLPAKLCDVMYVGDSITDVKAFKLVKENGGLTVSFNGNRYAVENSEIAVLSESNIVTAVIAILFFKKGKRNTLRLCENWNIRALKRAGVVKSLLEQYLSVYSSVLPKVQIVTAQNMDTLVKESSKFRKEVRGEAIGRLG